MARPLPTGNGSAESLMRWTTMLALACAALIVSVLIYLATGGRFVFFALPLLLGLPFIGRRRRGNGHE